MDSILNKLTSAKQQFTIVQTAYVLHVLPHELPSKPSTSNKHAANIFLSGVPFQQSRHVRTTGVGSLACRSAPSQTVSSGALNGAPAPTAVAQVSPPAAQTGTGLVVCRLRPDCARSGHARLCYRGSEDGSRSVHTQHAFIQSQSQWW